MIKIKREFNNGLFDCMEIYSDNYKIREELMLVDDDGNQHHNIILWNATEDSPICIAKSRLSEYSVSNELLDSETDVDKEE